MCTGRELVFRAVGFQIVALVAALSGARAQSSAAFGAVAAARSSRASAVFVAKSFQSPGLTSTNPGSDNRAFSAFASPPGLSTAGNELFSSVPAVATGFTASPASGPTEPQTFAYAAPADTFGSLSQPSAYTAPAGTFGILTQPNEPAITGNDLFPPLLDMLRSGILVDPRGHAGPDGVGSTMDTRGANHFEASVAPHWTFCRNSRYPITMSLPSQIMVEDDPYYFGHHYGWITTGVNVSVPLSFIPRQCGKWSAATSADLCYYGTTSAEFVNSIGIQMPKLAATLKLDL